MAEKKQITLLAGEGHITQNNQSIATVRYRLRVIDTIEERPDGGMRIRTEKVRTNRRIEGGGVVVSGDRLWMVKEPPACLHLDDGSGRALIFVPSGYIVTTSFSVDNNLGDFESE